MIKYDNKLINPNVNLAKLELFDISSKNSNKNRDKEWLSTFIELDSLLKSTMKNIKYSKLKECDSDVDYIDLEIVFAKYNNFIQVYKEHYNGALNIYKKKFSKIVEDYLDLKYSNIAPIFLSDYKFPVNIDTFMYIDTIRQNISLIMDIYKKITLYVPKNLA